MKISAKQKELNRQALLRASVQVITQDGYADATLRKISAAAGLSDPVIYTYFPTKQSLLYAFLESSLEITFTRLMAIPSMEALPFNEQIQLLMQTHLDVLAEDDAFVRILFPLVFVTGLSTTQEALAPCRRQFTDLVSECFDEAVRAGELAPPPFKETVIGLFWDFHVGVIRYWLDDQTEMKIATSELIQHTPGMVNEILKSQLLSRLSDMIYFLVRTHLLTPVHPPGEKGAAAPKKALKLFHPGKPE